MGIMANRTHDHHHSHPHTSGVPHVHLHDDDHHHGETALDEAELTRRRFLYLLAAGVAGGVAGAPLAAAASTPKKRATTAKKKSTKATPSVTTPSATNAATTTKAGSSKAAKDPWTLFPKTVRATRTTSEVVVESTGLPEHNMMVGITSWQQQVPLTQPFSGSNAWRLPLKGVLSDTPLSARHALYRGAIALAVNGVPIFNALNNRGDDAFLVGELDQWGGHCGRADDYHYHAAPLHLQSVTGPETPIAFALDGYPMYGLTEPDGSPVRALDEYNGHADPVDGYHYHATLTFPYVNGGIRGKVSVQNDGIEPQPTTPPMRPPGEPLRGAAITGFTTDGVTSKLEYRLNGGVYRIEYTVDGTSVRFVSTDPAGATKTETFQRRAR